ncbi:MAG TPA: chemotaxis-specific protein-glutamate methyltransferase CheB [Pseudogracilibacillus sp.]|nr:chemotaxis-specific protein-glutamate methyltransferase CheB [Pseudogracilibacillus sp.]
MEKINVLLIHPSVLFCKEMDTFLTNILSKGHVTSVTTIEKGIETIQTASINVILLDVKMLMKEEKSPVERLLETKSLPIIMLADHCLNQTAKTIQAMTNGAVDFIRLNQNDSTAWEQQKEQMCTKIEHAALAKLVRSESEKERKIPPQNIETNNINNREMVPSHPKFAQTIIAIGASTGGPRALQQILQSIPSDFSTPILIVQHMPSGFTSSLSKRLDNISHITVQEAKHGDIIEQGKAYIAPGNFHMKVKKQGKQMVIETTKEDTQLGHRPSINVLFDSLASLDSVHKIAVVLTGMGKDGAEGIIQIKESQPSAVILAESKDTAIINGMPNAAIQTNYVTEVLRLEHIVKALVDYTTKRGR